MFLAKHAKIAKTGTRPMQLRKRVSLLGALCVLGVKLFAAPVQAAPAQDALQQFVDRVQTLSARFEQVQKDERGEVLQASSGQLLLAKPGKFRWNYEKPYEQLMVCDGKTLWLYDPDLAQATRRPAGPSLQGTPAQLLTDRAALERHFRIEDAGTEAGARRLRLLPKAADGDFKSVQLWLKDGVPQRMRFNDQLGGVSDVSFSEIRTNIPLDPAQFRFEPPKGVEIIRADEPAKQ
jgi:outer membrane lipoprotein carrier protein